MRVYWKRIVLGSVTIAGVAAAGVATGIRGRDPVPPSHHSRPGSAARDANPVLKPASLQSVQDGDVTLTARSSATGERVLDGTAPDVTFSSATSDRGTTTLFVRDAHDEVKIDVSESGVVVVRGTNTCTIAREELAEDTVARCRSLFSGSSAVRAFRRASARLEQHGSTDLRHGALIAGALIAWLDGDPGAVERVARRMAPRAEPGVMAVSLASMSCYTDWEGEVVGALNDLISCFNETVWFLDPLCELGWFLRVESAWFRFIGCTGLMEG